MASSSGSIPSMLRSWPTRSLSPTRRSLWSLEHRLSIAVGGFWRIGSKSTSTPMLAVDSYVPNWGLLNTNTGTVMKTCGLSLANCALRICASFWSKPVYDDSDLRSREVASNDNPLQTALFWCIWWPENALRPHFLLHLMAEKNASHAYSAVLCCRRCHFLLCCSCCFFRNPMKRCQRKHSNSVTVSIRMTAWCELCCQPSAYTCSRFCHSCSSDTAAVPYHSQHIKAACVVCACVYISTTDKWYIHMQSFMSLVLKWYGSSALSLTTHKQHAWYVHACYIPENGVLQHVSTELCFLYEHDTCITRTLPSLCVCTCCLSIVRTFLASASNSDSAAL